MINVLIIVTLIHKTLQICIYNKREIMNQKEPKPTRLTVDQLRKYKGFEDFTDKEAEDAISSLAQLAYIALHDLKTKSEDSK